MATEKEPSFDGYKLRMVFGKWYLMLYHGEVDIGYLIGPATYKEALAEAQRRGLIDVERAMGDRGR